MANERRLRLDKLKSDKMVVDSEPCDPEEIVTAGTIKKGEFQEENAQTFFIDRRHAAKS